MKETKSNGFKEIIAQAIDEMKSEQGNHLSLEQVNLAELAQNRHFQSLVASLKKWIYFEISHS